MIVEHNETISFQGAPSSDAKGIWRKTESGALNMFEATKNAARQMLRDQVNNPLQEQQQSARCGSSRRNRS
jgi:hypothetical protein